MFQVGRYKELHWTDPTMVCKSTAFPMQLLLPRKLWAWSKEASGSIIWPRWWPTSYRNFCKHAYILIWTFSSFVLDLTKRGSEPYNVHLLQVKCATQHDITLLFASRLNWYNSNCKYNSSVLFYLHADVFAVLCVQVYYSWASAVAPMNCPPSLSCLQG